MNNQRGATLLEIIVASSLSVFVLAGVTVTLISEVKSQKKVESFFWLSQVRSEVIGNLKKKAVLDATILSASNPSMACLAPKTAGAGGTSLDCQGKGGPIVSVSDSSGHVLIDNSTASSGFTAAGKPCSSFSTTSTDCPFRFELSWEPVCPPTGACFSPDIKFNGNLLIADALKSQANPELYRFRWILPTTEKSDIVCNTSGIGTGTAGNCKLKLESTCPVPGEYVVGFKKDGTPTCGKLLASSCPGGLLQGFDTNGKAVCGGVCK